MSLDSPIRRAGRFILAGVIIGPQIPWTPVIHDKETIDTLAELGVILLMFSLGLEFSLRKLKQVVSSIEQFKEELGAHPASRFDLYKCRNGDIVIKRKGDSQGPGESTGYNIYSL